MKIALASDHAGFAFKRQVIALLAGQGHQCEDFGCRSEEPVDLSDHVAPAAEAVGSGRCEFGIFIDGAGYGSGMIANFHHGVFAAVANDPASARLAREHGGANVLCLGSKVAGELVLLDCVAVFLRTEPLAGKYSARREKVRQIAEQRRLGPLFHRRQVITVQDLKEAIAEKRPLIMDQATVITPSVIDGVRGLRP